MFTKDFIKISQVLDKYGMHKQADDLLRIAQAKPAQKSPVKPATKPAAKPAVKPAVPATSPVFMVNPTIQNNRIDFYTKAINNLSYVDPKRTKLRTKTQIKEQATYLKDQLNLQYTNNLLDYQSYKSLIDGLGIKARSEGFLDFDSTPLKPINPTAFPSNINEETQKGRNQSIILANPVEGITAAGEKAFSNREDRNLPGLVQEWNNYFDFKKPIEAQIEQMKALLPEDQLTKLNEILAKSTSAVAFKQELKKTISEFQGKNQPTQQLRQLDATLSQETAKSFEEQLQDRINALKAPGVNADTKDLEALLARVRSPEGLKAGDFGNSGANATEIYGVEAKPQTTITGTPTPPSGTPAAPSGTPVAPGTPAPPVAPVKPSPAKNPGSR